MEEKVTEKTFQFQDTTATRKIFTLTKRVRAVSGGTGASKTISILIWLIDYCQVTKNKVCTVVSESHPHLEKGTIADFKNIMRDRGYWKDALWNDTKHVYTFEGGSILEFYSVDKFGKAHGPRRDVLFLNEANNIEWLIADQLITRTRKVIWLDWNPSEEFWFYTEMKPNRTDIDFITLTYLDNEALDEDSKNEILAHKNNKNWWRVYGEGKLGEIEGRIYANWQIIDEIPHEARLERYGLDFGYDPDPAAIVAVYYYNGGYILDEILYARGIDNPSLAGMLKNLPPALVVADSAEPKSIDEIKKFQINIIGTPKGSDSVRYGVKTLQAQRISITKRSLNLIKEYRNFFQAIDRRTNNPIMGEYEGSRHLLDGARYAICSLIPIIQRREIIAQLPKFPNMPRTNPAV